MPKLPDKINELATKYSIFSSELHMAINIDKGAIILNKYSIQQPLPLAQGENAEN